MTQVPVLVCFQLPGLVHMEPKNAGFVNRRLKLTNDIQKIEPDNHFIFVIANFSTVNRKKSETHVAWVRQNKSIASHPGIFTLGCPHL